MMLKAKLSLWVVYQTSMILWYVKIYKYYFEYGMADVIGLIIFALASTYVILLPMKNWAILKWISMITLLTIPFLIFSMVSFGMELFNESWLLFYLFILLATFAFAFVRQVNFLILATVLSFSVWFLPIKMYPQQAGYSEKLIAIKATRKGEIHLTIWKQSEWVYYNKQLQYSTADKHIYAEAFAVPAMSLLKEGRVLILGGDNGLIASEVSKFPEFRLSIVPYDQEYSNFMRIENGQKRNDAIQNQSIFSFLAKNEKKFDLIFVDIPDPKNLDYAQYYSKEFYQVCLSRLSDEGFLVTQLGDAYYSKNVCLSGLVTLRAANMDPLFYHTQIPSLGQWGWGICQKDRSAMNLRKRLLNTIVPSSTKWLSTDAMKSMFMTGKWDYFESSGHVVNGIGTSDILTLERD